MDGWKCPKCGREYAKLDSFDRHKCRLSREFAALVKAGDTIRFRGDDVVVEKVGVSHSNTPTFHIHHKGSDKVIGYTSAEGK